MTSIWIARAWDHDQGAETIHVVVTDGAEQCEFMLRRSECAALYDFIVSHRREPSR